MSNSYKDEVPTPVKEQKPKKVKRQFNKRIRQHTKKVLEDYVSENVKEIDELLEKADPNNY